MADVNIAIIVLPAGIGALAAISGQLMTQLFEAKRHASALSQRRLELAAGYLGAAAERRLHAIELTYDGLQTALDEGRVSLDSYRALRPQLVYLPPHLRDTTLAVLSDLIGMTGAISDELSERIRRAQRELRAASGISLVEDSLQTIQGGKSEIGGHP